MRYWIVPVTPRTACPAGGRLAAGRSGLAAVTDGRSRHGDPLAGSFRSEWRSIEMEVQASSATVPCPRSTERVVDARRTWPAQRTVVGENVLTVRDRVQWGPVFAGSVVGLVALVLLALLGLGIG